MTRFRRNNNNVQALFPFDEERRALSVVHDTIVNINPELKKKARLNRLHQFDFIGPIAASLGTEVRNSSIENSRKIDYKKRRAVTGIVGVGLTGTALLALGVITNNANDSEVKPVSAISAPSPSVICDFSDETFYFVPKADQGWAVAIQQTKGAMQDSDCYQQERQYLEEMYGENPQKDLNLTAYPQGYPVPSAVHRVTTTISTVPTIVSTPQN